MPIRKLFIANRGEIAVRIIRAARNMKIRTVLGASQADIGSLAASMADEVVLLGPPPAAKSYLDRTCIIEAIRNSGADAVHPGYGFLSENADFAATVEKIGVTFVGPRHETIARMGDKAAARSEAIAAGVPVVPGSEGTVSGLAAARAVAERIGFPLLLKAAAGGGGRGIHIANSADELDALIPRVETEAFAAFGDRSFYLERYLAQARHIEVQVLGDGETIVHLHERECSLQRRRQKLWEEGPAVSLPAAVREALCASAVALAGRVGYRGAGTIEYLYDATSEAFYFIEMNTRIQVEHPVTEAITGVDLVEAQLRIAGGEKLWLRQDEITPAGHAIEIRINAEDPDRDFMPSPGTVSSLVLPDGARFDTLLFPGCKIVPFYDSLIGKLIVHAADRVSALSALRTALNQLETNGIATNVDLFRRLLTAADIQSGDIHTLWLETWIRANAVEGTVSTTQGS